MSNFMRIRPVGPSSMRVDGRTDMTKIVVAFRSFAKAPKTHRCALRCTSTSSLYTGPQARRRSYWFSYVMNSLLVCSLACKSAVVWDDPGDLWRASVSDFINANQREWLPWKLFIVTLNPWSFQLLSVNFKYSLSVRSLMFSYGAEEHSNLLKYHAVSIVK